MKRLQAFKFELKPNGEQTRSMRRFAGSCRFVFNKALAMQKALYESGEKKLGYAGLCKELTTWKSLPETLWLSETHSQVRVQAATGIQTGLAGRRRAGGSTAEHQQDVSVLRPCVGR
jgi:putative transposase